MPGFPSNEGVKEGYPPKKTLFCRYWLVYSVITVADKCRHAAYHTSTGDRLIRFINIDDLERP